MYFIDEMNHYFLLIQLFFFFIASGVQEKLGIMNNGQVFAVFEYDPQHNDELTLKNGDQLVILRKGDDNEREWWWSKLGHREGYVPRNLLGVSLLLYF